MRAQMRLALWALAFALLSLSPALAVRLRQRDGPSELAASSSSSSSGSADTASAANDANKASETPVGSHASKSQPQEQQQSGDPRSEYSGENVDGQVSVSAAHDPNTDDAVASAASSASTAQSHASESQANEQVSANVDEDADEEDSTLDEEHPHAASSEASGASAASDMSSSSSPVAAKASACSSGADNADDNSNLAHMEHEQHAHHHEAEGQQDLTAQGSLPPNTQGIKIDVSPLVYQETTVNVGNGEKHVKGHHGHSPPTATPANTPPPASGSHVSLEELRKGEFMVRYVGAADLNNLSRGAEFLVKEASPGHWSATIMNDRSPINEKGTEMTHVSDLSPNNINIWGHELTYKDGMFYFVGDGSLFGELVMSA